MANNKQPRLTLQQREKGLDIPILVQSHRCPVTKCQQAWTFPGSQPCLSSFSAHKSPSREKAKPLFLVHLTGRTSQQAGQPTLTNYKGDSDLLWADGIAALHLQETPVSATGHTVWVVIVTWGKDTLEQTHSKEARFSPKTFRMFKI